LLISAAITAGNCGDRDGLKVLLYYCKQMNFCPKKIYADQGYAGKDFKFEVKSCGVDLETVKRREHKGFALEAKRWIVERTFAWLGKCRRLSKEYELIPTSSLSMIYLAMARLVVRRISLLA
jgi:transposase